MSAQDQEEFETQHDAGGGADELSDALSESGEMAFVTEEKKPVNRSTMVMLGLLLAGVGLTYFMYLRTGPQSAGAAPTEEATAANETITQFLDNGNQNIQVMEQMLRNTEKVVQQFLRYPSTTQVPLSGLQTNPFRHTAVKREQAVHNDIDEKKRREEERQAVLKAVQALQLQSVMHSETRKACMINNTLFQENQQVESFVIEKINPHSVIVKSGVYRFELKMQK